MSAEPERSPEEEARRAALEKLWNERPELRPRPFRKRRMGRPKKKLIPLWDRFGPSNGQQPPQP